MPALLQASISNVPAGAVSFFPSTFKVTSGIKLSFVIGRWSFGLHVSVALFS